MEMMFIKDIEKEMSNMMQEYLNKGYRLYTKASGGSQGELISVFITNDKEIICLSLEKEFSGNREKLILYTRKYDNFNNDLWLNDEFIINKKVYYIIDELTSIYKTPFTDDEKEFNDIEEKRRKRTEVEEYGNRCYYNNDKVKNIVLSFIKRQPKCKTVKLNDIKVERIQKKRKNIYNVITKNNRTFTLK